MITGKDCKQNIVCLNAASLQIFIVASTYVSHTLLFKITLCVQQFCFLTSDYHQLKREDKTSDTQESAHGLMAATLLH